jgi:hypothetical protein
LHLPGGAEENNEKSKSEYTMSGKRFEPRTSLIRSRRADESSATFGNTLIGTVKITGVENWNMATWLKYLTNYFLNEIFSVFWFIGSQR